jgi:uncharacterized membrane protein YbhN (UPF0104 family)
MPARRAGRIGRSAAVAAKLLVTGLCLWYVARQVDLDRVLAAFVSVHPGWTALAVAAMMLEIPLVAWRWRNILLALAALPARATRVAVTAVTAIGAFVGQVLPSVAGDGARTWLLVRLGADWRNAVTSVLIDRAVGVALLVALGFLILLPQSDLAALGGGREQVLVAYGALLALGLVGLLSLPWIVPVLGRWRSSRWLALLGASARHVLLGPRGPAIVALGLLVHALTIAAVWSLGQALGLALALPDAAVLFTIMVGAAIVPISVGGWGVRELAVVALLGRHGGAPEQALLLSVCFGLVVALAALPGALVWLVYPLRSGS